MKKLLKKNKGITTRWKLRNMLCKRVMLRKLTICTATADAVYPTHLRHTMIQVCAMLDARTLWKAACLKYS